MRKWFEAQGYVMVYRLAVLNGPIGRWLHDRWCAIWYRYYCPHPIIAETSRTTQWENQRTFVTALGIGSAVPDHSSKLIPHQILTDYAGPS
jgi:hypothetical protein